MFTVFADDICIHDDKSPSEKIKLLSPKLTLADNSAGSFTFTMAPTNVGFDSITRMKTEIRVLRNDEEIWSGRAVSEESDFYGNHAFTCEGELAYLNDVLQPAAAYDDATVDAFLGAVLNNYNNKASQNRQFTRGIVTVQSIVHPGTFGVSQSVNTTTNMSSTWDVIKNTLVDVYGGHLRVRKENGVRYLDYLADYPNLSEQTIDFGKNLMDFTQNWDETDLTTVIYPRGKKLEDEVDNDGITGKITKTRHKSNSQYDVEFQITWINHGVPQDSKYDYEIVLVLFDPRYPGDDRFAPAFVTSDVITLEPGNNSNQTFTHLIRDFEPGLQYRYKAWIEYKRNGETAPNYEWLPEPYQFYRPINHGAGAHTIVADDAFGNHVIEGTYTVQYNGYAVSDYQIEVELAFHNPGAPLGSYYEYRIEMVLDDPVRGDIRKYGTSVTVPPGDQSDITGYALFTGLDNSRSYGLYGYVNYRPAADDTWRKLGAATPVANEWNWLPEPYQMYRLLFQDVNTRNTIYADDSQGHHVLEGSYYNSFYSSGGTEFETSFDITYNNSGNPTVGDAYEYRIEVVLVDPERGDIRKSSNITTVAAGATDNVTGTVTFTGLKTSNLYGFHVLVQYRKQSTTTTNIYEIEHTFDAHFTDNELDGIEKRVSVRSVNNGVDYVENQTTLATYGRIEKVVTWDYIEDPAKLLALANWYLSDYQFNNLILSIKALDLSYLDVDYDRIRLLDRVKAISQPHDMNHEFPVTKLEIPLDHPENTTFTLGDKPRDSYTASLSNETNDIYNQIRAIPSTGDILSEIGSAGYKVLTRAKENARMILDSRTNGTITIVEGEDGYSDALYFSETKDYTEATRFWRWNMNGLGFIDHGEVKVGITNDGAINADLITVGLMLVDRIRLYGLMGVYNQRTGGNVGGYIGYGEGSKPDSSQPSGYARTSGIMISNTKRITDGVEEPGYLRYFIATDSGVRMQAGAQSFYLNDDYVDGHLSGTAELITSNAFTFRVGGIRLSPAMPTDDVPHPADTSYDSGINGTLNIGDDWINIHHGIVVQASTTNILSGVPSRITALENKTANMSFDYDQGRLVLRAMDSGVWQERIVASPAGTTIKAGPQNLATVNNSTFEVKAQDGVLVSGNSTETKMAWGSHYLSLQQYLVMLQYDQYQYLSFTNTETNLTYTKGSDDYLGKGIKISSNGINLFAHPYQAWVSSESGFGPTPSDRRFKKDITYDVDGDILDDLKPVRYKFKTAEPERYGFIAQDVQEVIPSIVETAPEGDRLYLHYNDIIAILTAKVQKQAKKIKDLEERLARLEALVLGDK